MTESDYKGCSIKAKKLPNGEEKTNAFVADKGDKIQFTVTLKDFTNVEEWKVNGTSLEYGTASFTVTVDGVVNVTALVDKSQFEVSDNAIAGHMFSDFYIARTTANDTLVIPSKIGSHNIQTIRGTYSYSIFRATHAYIADGIENISTIRPLFDDVVLDDKYRSRISSLRLPNTLKIIGNQALYRIPHLVRYLVIPKSVKKIDSSVVYKESYRDGDVKALGLSIYFEHETDEDFEKLILSESWCDGILYRLNDRKYPIKIYVKNTKLLKKLNTLPYGTCNVIYKPFTSVPAEGDGRYEWSW